MKCILIWFAFFLPAFFTKCIGQNTENSKIAFRLRHTYYYNYYFAHQCPSLSIEINRHNFYAGVYLTKFLETWDKPSRIYNANPWGVNLGYRYMLTDTHRKVLPFIQFNYGVYRARYKAYSLGPHVVEKKELFVENTVSAGVNFELIKRLRLYAGLGFGSYGGFFLLLDSFILSGYIGMELRL